MEQRKLSKKLNYHLKIVELWSVIKSIMTAAYNIVGSFASFIAFFHQLVKEWDFI